MERFKFSAKTTAITFAFCGHSAGLRWREEKGTALLTITLPYDAAYGMGEKYDSFNQKGSTVINCVEEQFCHQEKKTYCTAPFFITNTGLGLYVETDCVTTFHFGKEITVSMPLDAAVVILEGTPKAMISEYMSLFGPAKLPPKWAFGPWISANHWDTQVKAEAQLTQLRNHDFSATVLVLEAWSDEATFYIFNGARYASVPGNEALKYADFDFTQSMWPNPRGMIDNLHQDGVHLVLWQIPVYKKQGSEELISVQNENDRDFVGQQKLCVQMEDGTPYQIPENHWFAGSMIPDFTNPETERLWFAKRQYLLDMGVDGFKTDGGEFVYRANLKFADGSTSAQLKNRYAQSYIAAYTKFIGDDRVLFSRAGYSGQHTTPILWAGDQQSENCELKSVLNAGLSAAMTGIPFWGFDIAGFAGSLPTLDLYRRATQLACFCPIMQWHSEPDGGQFRELMPTAKGNNERSPWNIAAVYDAPEFEDEMRFWHNLRMNLLPYLYSTALDCVRKSRPMLRPLVYDFPDDEAVRDINNEFLLGESVLIAPMLEENAQNRIVYLPGGIWYNMFTEESQQGGQTKGVFCEGSLPVFLRAGHGMALNLNDSLKLGSRVGNRVDTYKNLHFYLTGKNGVYHFSDDLGNDFTLKWSLSSWTQTGHSTSPFTVKIIQ